MQKKPSSKKIAKRALRTPEAARGRTHIIRSAEQLRALRTASRLQVLNTISRLKACSVAQLAVQLGKPAGSLYYSVNQLLAAGLIREVEKRRAGKRYESVYATVAPRIKIDTSLKTSKFYTEVLQAYRSLLRSTERDLRDVIDLCRRDKLDVSEYAMLRRLQTPLKPKAAAQFKKKLAELETFLARNSDSSNTEDYVYTFTFYRIGASES